MLSLRTLATSVLVAFWSASAAAQCPGWSDAFAPGGLNGNVTTFQVHDSGQGPELFAGGAFDHAGSESTGSVARWNGLRWESLGSQLGGTVEAFAVYDAGNGSRLYAGGNGLLGATCLAVWDGTMWSPVPGFFGGSIQALAVFQGSLYIGGGGWDSNAGIGRWNGTSYSGIGGVLGGSVLALIVHDDGQGPALFVGGSFAYAGGIPASHIARWSGSGWSSVGPHPMTGIYDLTVHDFGGGPELVAAGSGGAFLTMRWNGASWSSMPGLNTGLGGGLARAIYSTGAGPSAELYVGGSNLVVAGGNAGNVARWVGSSWVPLGSEFDAAVVLALVEHDTGSGAHLFVGGRIGLAGAVSVDNVAMWDGNTWAATTQSHAIGVYGQDFGVIAMTRFDDGGGEQLYVGGMFESAGGIAMGSLARWNGTSWSSIGDVDGQIRALCAFDDGGGPQLYAGGQFTSIGGVQAEAIARWNGSTWSALPDVPLVSPGYVLGLLAYDDGSGPALYAAGKARIAGAGIALALRWQNGQWSNVGAPVPPCHSITQLNSLVVHAENGVSSLYGCGFDLPGDCSLRTGVVRWDGANWSNVGGPFLSTSGLAVGTLASHDDGGGAALYVAGLFTSAGGVLAKNIARWRDGAWSGLGSGTNSSVIDLASFDEGDGLGPKLVACGSFSSAGGSPAARLARWHQGAWSEFAGGVHPIPATNGFANTMFVEASGSSRGLYVGGKFARAGTQAVGNLARLDACDETGRTYCYGDGSATPCPCGNASSPGERAGCLHSLGSGGTLRARGEPSLANDSLRIDGASMPNSSALYFQSLNSTSGGLGVPFGDGIKCTNGPFVRLLTKVNVSGASTFPEAGDPSMSVKGMIGAPCTRHYQVRYRNAASFCSSETFNYTNAIEIVWRL